MKRKNSSGDEEPPAKRSKKVNATNLSGKSPAQVTSTTNGSVATSRIKPVEGKLLKEIL